jgi:hypothetical protein
MFIFLLLIPILLWFFAIKFVSESGLLRYFFISNIFIAISGFFILTNTDLIDLSGDRDGLLTLFALFFFVLCHSILGFLFGLFLKMYQNK